MYIHICTYTDRYGCTCAHIACNCMHMCTHPHIHARHTHPSLHTCMHLSVQACTHTHTHNNASTHTHTAHRVTDTCTHKHALHSHAHTHPRMHATRIHTRKHLSPHACSHKHTHTLTHTCMHTPIHKHTQQKIPHFRRLYWYRKCQGNFLFEFLTHFLYLYISPFQVISSFAGNATFKNVKEYFVHISCTFPALIHATFPGNFHSCRKCHIS